MFDFHERRKVRYIIYSKPVLVLLTIVALLFLYSVYGALQKEKETRTTKNQREQVLEELNVREEALKSEIDRLNTPKGLEAEIRSKFEVAMDGEEVIIIVDAPKEEKTDEQPEEKSFFQKMFDN